MTAFLNSVALAWDLAGGQGLTRLHPARNLARPAGHRSALPGWEQCVPEHGVRSGYSTCPFELMTLDQNGVISTATAFFFENAGVSFVVTNWHVVSGKHFLTKDPVDGQGRCPARMVAKLATYEVGDAARQEFGIAPFEIALYEEEQPVWFEHPTFGSLCDVVAIPLERPKSCPSNLHRPANRMWRFKRGRTEGHWSEVRCRGANRGVFLLVGRHFRRSLPAWPDSGRARPRTGGSVRQAGEAVGSGQVATAPTERAMRRQSSANGAPSGRWTTMRRTDVSIQAPSFGRRSRKAPTCARAARPPSLQAKFLHRHAGGRRHEDAELAGQEARAASAVDLQSLPELLQPVLGIAPGAVHPLADVIRRRLQVRDREPRAVLRWPAEMGGHLGLDDDPALTGPTPGLTGERAVAAGRCAPRFDIGPHLLHRRFGKALQRRVLGHAHHALQSLRLEKREQLRAGMPPVQADPRPRLGKRPPQPGQQALQHTDAAVPGGRLAGAQDAAEQTLLHLVVEGQETAQRQMAGRVVEAVEECQLLAAMGLVQLRLQRLPPRQLLRQTLRLRRVGRVGLFRSSKPLISTPNRSRNSNARSWRMLLHLFAFASTFVPSTLAVPTRSSFGPSPAAAPPGTPPRPHRSCCAETCRSCRGPGDSSPPRTEPRCPDASRARSGASRRCRWHGSESAAPASSAGGTAPNPCRARSPGTNPSEPAPPPPTQNAPGRRPAASPACPAAAEKAAIGPAAGTSASARNPIDSEDAIVKSAPQVRQAARSLQPGKHPRPLTRKEVPAIPPSLGRTSMQVCAVGSRRRRNLGGFRWFGRVRRWQRSGRARAKARSRLRGRFEGRPGRRWRLPCLHQAA